MTDQQAYAKGDQGSDGPANPIARRYSRWSHGPAEIAEDKKAAGVTEINAKVTFYVIASCVVASFGGILFGYDAGITGGVEAMDQFAESFFPATAGDTKASFWCSYDDKKLQAYSATMHFTGAVASIAASYFTQRQGRTRSMLIGGVAYVAGAICQAAAKNTYAPLFLGRVLWGIGVGFGDHCAFIYTAEMAPPAWRGRLAALVQGGVTTGIVFANAINLGFNFVPFGWRFSFGIAAVPGAILLLGGLFLPDTPNSLCERGHVEKSRQVLEKVRGTKDVDAEFESIVYATGVAEASENPFIALLRRKNRPQLVLAIAMPFFQQWSGVNAVSFFAPQIFGGAGILGEGNLGELSSALLVDGVQMIACWITVVIVDYVGRRVLLLCGTMQGAVSLIAAGVVLKYASQGHAELATAPAGVVTFLVCIYTISFGYGLGPIAWLIPAEIHDINTRSAGQSITVFTQLISGAVVTQCFLAMLCSLKYGAFIFFGLWQGIAFLFVLFLVPETRGIPIEQVPKYVRAHKFWRHVVYDGGNIPPVEQPPSMKRKNGIPEDEV